MGWETDPNYPITPHFYPFCPSEVNVFLHFFFFPSYSQFIHRFFTAGPAPFLPIFGFLSGPPIYLQASKVQTADFHYDLPANLIAQEPTTERDQSRLFVLRRDSRTFEHRHFCDLPALLDPGDLLILNNTRVLPARLRGAKPSSGGAIEMLLIEELALNNWRVMLKPGKRVRAGSQVRLNDRDGSPVPVSATILSKNEEGHCEVVFAGTPDIRSELETLGDIPLPPYISRNGSGAKPADFLRYQTVFAREPGSVAAPTAGLHFTPQTFERLKERRVETAEVTLHVGLGTFAPVKVTTVEAHRMHEESFDLPTETVATIERTRSAGGRVVAVGTTAFRVLESVAAMHDGKLAPTRSRTRLFVYPPYTPKVVNCLLTNFHLPESTLLMLVSAFASPGRTDGRELILQAYEEAIAQKYRFFSYGDAMLIL